MNQTEYQKILKYKKKFEEERKSLQKKRQNIINVQIEIQKLEQELEKKPKVQKYLAKKQELKKLKEEHLEAELSDEQIIYKSVNSFISEEDKEIFIFVGKYSKKSSCKRDENAEDYDFISYDSIPYLSYTSVDKENVKAFESSHIVLYPPKDTKSDEFCILAYKKYCEALINFGPEEAKKQIVNEFQVSNMWASANQRILNRFMKKN